VRGGLDHGVAPILWRLEAYRERGAFQGPERRIWLLGSSILREAVDVDALNLGLAGSGYRGFKLAFIRGAPALTAGFLDRVPVASGDLVVHGVACDNFVRGWFKRTRLPLAEIGELMPLAEIWAHSDLAWQDKLSLSVAYPRQFYTLHHALRASVSRGFKTTPLPESSDKFRFWTLEYNPGFGPLPPAAAKRPLAPEDFDWSDAHPNARGLVAMRQKVEARGATLVLVTVPPRPSYVPGRVTKAAWARWQVWLEAQGVRRLAALPEPDYYDWGHPNYRGRATATAELTAHLRTMVAAPGL
jgi:hypothetical protein